MKPILFNTDMVKAILEGRKTVTRRLIKPQPKTDSTVTLFSTFNYVDISYDGALKLSPYQPGDILYVRETWQYAYDANDNDQLIMETGRYVYYAHDPMPFGTWIDADTGEHKDFMPWKPSIHMPKEAARIFLRVTNVSVAKLQNITEEQAKAEGAKAHHCLDALNAFRVIWDSTLKSEKELNKYGWFANPWVWVIEFERITKLDNNA